MSPIKINIQWKWMSPIIIDVPETLITIAESGLFPHSHGEPNQYISLRSNYRTDTKWVEKNATNTSERLSWIKIFLSSPMKICSVIQTPWSKSTTWARIEYTLIISWKTNDPRETEETTEVRGIKFTLCFMLLYPELSVWLPTMFIHTTASQDSHWVNGVRKVPDLITNGTTVNKP